MKKIVGLLLVLVCLHNTGYAADVPWDSALDTLTKNIQTIARPIVAILVAVTGLMTLFGTGEGNKQVLIRMVLGLGLALQVTDYVTGPNSLFKELADVWQGNVPKPAPFSFTMNGTDKGINFIGNFMTYYQQIIIYGAKMIMPTALKLLGFLTIIDMTMTLIFKMEGDHVKYLLHQILKVGFFIFLIENWIGGTGALANIANTIFTSFEQIGINATGMTTLKPENILTNGFEVVTVMLESVSSNFWKGNPLMTLISIVLSFVIFCVVALTSMELIMIRFEFWTISLVILVMIPFGAYNHTRFLFEKAIGATFNLGIKMAVVSFVCIIGAPILSGMIDEMSKTQGVMNNITMLLQILFGASLIWLLAHRVPALAAGFFNGQPTLGGGDMFAPVKGAYNSTAAAMGQVEMAKALPGGRGADGSVNLGGSLKNLAAATMKQPMTDTYHKSAKGMWDSHNMRIQNANIMNEAKNGKAYSSHSGKEDKQK